MSWPVLEVPLKMGQICIKRSTIGVYVQVEEH